MSTHDPKSETPDSVPQGGRPRRTFTYVAAALASGVLLGAFAGSSAGQGLGRRMLEHVPGIAASAAPFEYGFGTGFSADWQRGLFDGAIEALVEAHADRMIRHLSIDIDATADQQERLRAIVRDAIKDLLPVREKMRAARAAARQLLTEQTIDRAAIEKFRSDQIAIHDAASKRLVAAVADAGEVLTGEQRRKLNDMLAAYGGRWGGGPWWGRRFLIWRN
jgi:Spy/CpxP family protein refolding chaperone